MKAIAIGCLFVAIACAHGESPRKVQGPNAHLMIIVAAGEYAVGAKDAVRNPTRTVKLHSFAIAEAETTNAQFAKFVAATGYVTDAEKRGFGKISLEGMPDWAWKEEPGAHWRRPFGGYGKTWEEIPNHPVTQISGADAEAYCKWLGVRLPTLDEWEVAARAGTRTRYPWGERFDPKMANVWNGDGHMKNTREDGYVYTAPVKSYPPNAWGLYDVIGNVFEYCTGQPLGSQPGDAQRLQSGRGGSWWCSFTTCHFFNLGDIGHMDKHGSLANQGFRVAMDPEKLKK